MTPKTPAQIATDALAPLNANPGRYNLHALVVAAIEADRAQRGTDHPQEDCRNCGHRSDCATHNAPAMPPGPCDCHRTITIDLDTGDWLSDSVLYKGDGARVAASVLPGMPEEEVDRAYSAWMSDNPAPEELVEMDE